MRLSIPFHGSLRAIKWNFGYTKVHWRGAAKSTTQALKLFAPPKPWMIRLQLFMAS